MKFRSCLTQIQVWAQGKSMTKILKESRIKTPIGDMRVIADDSALYLLEFYEEDKPVRLPHTIEVGNTKISEQVTEELKAYFSGTLKSFGTPLAYTGTDFQCGVWDTLKTIPYGETFSYAKQAANMNKPRAVRAVANANRLNKIAIIISCHRVIGSDGSLTGYAGGLDKKKWLLDHEARNTANL